MLKPIRLNMAIARATQKAVAFCFAAWMMPRMDEKMPDFFSVEDFVPGLRQAVEEEAFDLKKMIRVALPIKDPHEQAKVDLKDRREIWLTDGKKSCLWETDSLRALFRGDKRPPVLGDYPEAYNEVFALLDMHVLELSRFIGDRLDAEMLEIYSCLRRRPDGKSMGLAHDYMWQAAAFILGSRPLSQAEFEAIMSRLERSCRTFQLGPGSRNYVAALRTLEEAD
jgi:hypothetical protein